MANGGIGHGAALCFACHDLPFGPPFLTNQVFEHVGVSVLPNRHEPLHRPMTTAHFCTPLCLPHLPHLPAPNGQGIQRVTTGRGPCTRCHRADACTKEKKKKKKTSPPPSPRFPRHQALAPMEARRPRTRTCCSGSSRQTRFSLLSLRPSFPVATRILKKTQDSKSPVLRHHRARPRSSKENGSYATYPPAHRPKLP